MRARLVFALSCAAVCLALAAPARAQVVTEPAPPPFPDPKKFARGFFAQGELGAFIFVGEAGRYAGPGPAFGVRMGYDILRWLAVQAHVLGSSSEATLPPPRVGQSFQTLIYAGEARFSLQLRRFQLFAQAGAGLAQMTNNALDVVGLTSPNLTSLAVLAGLGLDFHTLNRHFSLGAGADYAWLQTFGNSNAISVTAYLKYTH